MTIRSNVDAREFDRRGEFQRQSRSQNGATGEITVTWIRVGVPIWCRLDSMPAKERFAAEKVNQVRAYTLWVRADVVKRFALDASMRFVTRGMPPFNIVDIPDNGLRGRKTAVFLEAGLSHDGR